MTSRLLALCLASWALSGSVIADDGSDETCEAGDPGCHKEDPEEEAIEEEEEAIEDEEEEEEVEEPEEEFWMDYGGGCRPLEDLSEEERKQAVSDREFHFEALPEEAASFSCYSGTQASFGQKPWRDAGFADAAVVLVEDFLSKEEVEHFRELTLGNVKASEADPTKRSAYAGGQQYEGEMINSHPELNVNLPDDEILNEVEKRIGDVLGIPATADEYHLQLVMTVGRPDMLGVENTHQAIHHDKNSGMIRQATAIVYIHGGEEGGETVFPALPLHPDGVVERTPEQKRFGQALHDIVEKKYDKLTPEVPWPSVLVEEDTDLYKDMIKACPEERDGVPAENATLPLIIKPTPGRAVFFWHETKKMGRALSDVFHLGCRVKKGVKMAIQKFKHFSANNKRCTGSKMCRLGFRRATEFQQKGQAITQF